MRISKLSEQAGLPVGTVKFYLRTGLLHAGRATSATQAQYDESHLRRLRLIRALLEVGGLSLADIQRVLDAIDLPTDDPDANAALVRAALAAPTEEVVDLEPARRVVADLGWTVEEDSVALPQLARAIAAIESVGLEVPADRLRVYADAAFHVSRSDLLSVEEAADADKALVAAAAVLFDALLTSLRRLSAEHQVARRQQQQRVPAPRLTLPGA
jgi:DNA-binding transcriptional MerR regulator